MKKGGLRVDIVSIHFRLAGNFVEGAVIGPAQHYPPRGTTVHSLVVVESDLEALVSAHGEGHFKWCWDAGFSELQNLLLNPLGGRTIARGVPAVLALTVSGERDAWRGDNLLQAAVESEERVAGWATRPLPSVAAGDAQGNLRARTVDTRR